MTALPRITKVSAEPFRLSLAWKGGGSADVDLAGWIATGGDVLSPLSDPEVFATAQIAEHGSAVSWGSNDDLIIDAVHLEMLAKEQRPFTSEDLVKWQALAGISNQEAKDFLGVALSTYNAYKAGAAIPMTVALACRAAIRDPIYLQAHLKPRKPGRPKKQKGKRPRKRKAA